MISLTVPTTNVSRRVAWAKVAHAYAIVAASLWDFRIHNLRVFDLAAFVFSLRLLLSISTSVAASLVEVEGEDSLSLIWSRRAGE